MRKLLMIFTLFFFSTSGFASLAHQEFPEQILRFISDVTVNKDASLDITETITVHTNQTEMQHGLMRWLPKQNAQNNFFTPMRYHIVNVLMNNMPAPYTFRQQNKRWVIDIGDAKKLLAPGEYTYTIHYHVTNALTFLNNQDQLNWNMTGTDWDFPIQYAEASITLPDGANISHYVAYVGNQADKYPFLRVTFPQVNRIMFVTTQPLILRRGMTVDLVWPKGLITPPSWQDSFRDALVENYAILLGVLGLVLVYFILASARKYRGKHEKPLVG